MADSNSQLRSSRLALTILGIIALLGLAYAILRVDILRARIATLEVTREQQAVTNASLQARNENLIAANLATQEQLKHLAAMESELTNMNATLGELRGRTEQSQRSWTRVETLYLLRLADDQLHLAQDIPTALAALQAAESRLNATRDNSLDSVRQQLSVDIAAIRNVPQIDRVALYSQLDQAQTSVAKLKVLGSVINTGNADSEVDRQKAGIERAWLLIKESVAKLFVVRKVSTSAQGLLTAEDETLRQHHLQLLLLSLKQSAQLYDGQAFRENLKQAQAWVNAAFDIKDKQVAVLDQQLTAWSKLDVAPLLPDISGSRKLLEKYSSSVTSP